MTRNVPSDESRHLLEGVRPAGNWSPACVTLVPSPHVVGDSLVLATIADDVALHDYQISTIKEFKTERVNEPILTISNHIDLLSLFSNPTNGF